MAESSARQYLDFEKPIKDLYDQIDQLKATAEKNKVDLTSSIQQLEEKILEKKQEINKGLTSWQKVQLSRHPDRPYTLSYIERICTDFVEMHGDRNFKDDKAIVGGFGKIDGQTVMILGQQKGTNTKSIVTGKQIGRAHV